MTKVSYDGVRLLALANGERVPRPFHYRWLLPKCLGTDGTRWRIAQVLCFAAVSVALWKYTGAWAALFVPFGLAGVYRLNVVEFPILTDLPAMAYGLFAAVLAQRGDWWLAIPLVLLAGMCKETAPVFAACWAWSPWLLVGLLAPAARALVPAGKRDPVADVEGDNVTEARAALVAPFRTAWAAHNDLWKDPWVLLAPWGILLAAFAHPTLQLGVVCALAYGQLLVATDTCRLYQWAFPVLALETFHTIPRPWWWLAVVVHLASPCKTGGL